MVVVRYFLGRFCTWWVIPNWWNISSVWFKNQQFVENEQFLPEYLGQLIYLIVLQQLKMLLKVETWFGSRLTVRAYAKSGTPSDIQNSVMVVSALSAYGEWTWQYVRFNESVLRAEGTTVKGSAVELLRLHPSDHVVLDDIVLFNRTVILRNEPHVGPCTSEPTRSIVVAEVRRWLHVFSL